jgi:transcriptional regulator with XRE-family HTH domain
MPHPADAHVGQKIRHCRWIEGLTQEQLGQKCGLSAGEIENMENGNLPLGVGGLFDIAAALSVPVRFFFEGLPGPDKGSAEKRATVLLERDAMDLVRTYYSLRAEHRKGLLDLAHTLKNSTG